MYNSKYVQGIFKSELNNRFLCLVDVDGCDTLCYIPSSCKLSNFVDLTNKTVLLVPNASKNARTKYSVYAVYTGRQYVLLSLQQANKIIENSIHSRRFSFLGKRTKVKAEYKIGGYKSDLFIGDSNTIIEIKSILSFEKNSIFPSVYSQRAFDQLVILEQLLDEGYNVYYYLVSLNPSVKCISLNNEAPEFCELFQRCVQSGMIVKGFSIKLKDNEPYIYSNLRINL